ncbi:MAG: DUF4129 domain-containing protein [Caldilineaceae bacterium]|nr:DUF4129 domain-containing protein [Caldilineaceae bacterium]
MLLTNRRHRLLFAASAGMELAWMLPYLLLFIRAWVMRADPETVAALGTGPTNAALLGLVTAPAVATFTIFWLVMLLYMLVMDLLNRSLVETPLRELILVAAIMATALLCVRFLLYPSAPPADMHRLSNFFSALFNFPQGRRPELAVLLVNFLLWFRVASLTGRELSFFNVGLRFRLGLLLSILGGGLLNRFAPASRPNGLVYLLIFFAFGLVAAALARMDEKALRSPESRGATLPWPRFWEMLGAAGLTLGGAWALARFYTPAAIRTVLGWFSPLWNLLGAAAGYLLLGVAWLLTPIMEAVIAYLRRLLEQAGLFDELNQQQAPLELPSAGELSQVDVAQFLNQWPAVRYGLVVLGLALALGIIRLFMHRRTAQRMANEVEEYGAEQPHGGDNLLRKALDTLRNWGDLIRRYGVGTQLLAAVSVQNIYANVGRLARGRGHPRPPSQPPDEYLPALMQAFPDRAEQLRRITDAYMRVEYGEHPVTAGELEQLRADFRAVQQAPELESEGKEEIG